MPLNKGHISQDKAYIHTRTKEGRILEDGVLLNLPNIPKSSKYFAEWQKRKHSFNQFSEYLQTNYSKNKRVLDLGCGNAWMTAKIAEMGYNSTGLDINKSELNQAARVFDHKNLTLVCGDIFSNLPIGKFDLIVISAAIQYFDDLDQLFTKIGEYLNPKGKLLIMDSFFYQDEEILNAKKRSETYYSKLGVSSMSTYYFHHAISQLKNYNHQYIYKPKIKGYNPFSKPKTSPFPMLLINELDKKHQGRKEGITSHKVIDQLAYFDLFNHPLKEEEIRNLIGSTSANQKTTELLRELIEYNICNTYKGYYALNSSIKNIVDKRIKMEARAMQFYDKIPPYVKIMKHFPFIKAIAISGSLSKGIADKDADTDYFLITSENRLWIARSMLVIFKKLFLLNSRKFFCINYFIGENHLEIPDKNVFTATEIAFLIPVYNQEKIEEFKVKNNWYKKYYPNFSHPIQLKGSPYKSNFFKKLLEQTSWIFFANQIDNLLLKITLKKWQNKFKSVNNEDFKLSFRSLKHVSKHHPKNYQSKVLQELEQQKSKLYIKLEKQKQLNAQKL